LEMVDAQRTRAVDDCPAQWCGNVLRLVCRAIPLVLVRSTFPL